MRWRRAIVAVVVGAMIAGFGSPYMFLCAIYFVREYLGLDISLLRYTAIVFVIVSLPALSSVVLVYGLGKPLTDGHTHCGNCNYILKGLTVPRCPECGEWI